MRKSVYNDKNGIALNEGDRIEGRTNFDTVQGVVVFDDKGSNDEEKWRILIDKHFKNGQWVAWPKYSLYLAYHHDENNNCIYYQKIETEIIWHLKPHTQSR